MKTIVKTFILLVLTSLFISCKKEETYRKFRVETIIHVQDEFGVQNLSYLSVSGTGFVNLNGGRYNSEGGIDNLYAKVGDIVTIGYVSDGVHIFDIEIYSDDNMLYHISFDYDENGKRLITRHMFDDDIIDYRESNTRGHYSFMVK